MGAFGPFFVAVRLLGRRFRRRTGRRGAAGHAGDRHRARLVVARLWRRRIEHEGRGRPKVAEARATGERNPVGADVGAGRRAGRTKEDWGRWQDDDGRRRPSVAVGARHRRRHCQNKRDQIASVEYGHVSISSTDRAARQPSTTTPTSASDRKPKPRVSSFPRDRARATACR